MQYLKHTLLLAICILTFSCSKETEAPSTTSIIQQGKWQVALYTDNGVNETSTYSGYQFTFKSNGTVTAVKGTTTIDGTWNTGGDENLNRLVLNFGLISFLELNANWLFLEKSYEGLKLESVSSNGTETDVLILNRL